MTDRELLELAAKAAGVTHLDWIGVGLQEQRVNDVPHCGPVGEWNPLNDDGDALRLAVMLQISLAMNQPVGGVEAWYGKNGFFTREKFNDKCDATGATRRAIVRAAAEIGKAMP